MKNQARWMPGKLMVYCSGGAHNFINYQIHSADCNSAICIMNEIEWEWTAPRSEVITIVAFPLSSFQVFIISLLCTHVISSLCVDSLYRKTSMASRIRSSSQWKSFFLFFFFLFYSQFSNAFHDTLHCSMGHTVRSRVAAIKNMTNNFHWKRTKKAFSERKKGKIMWSSLFFSPKPYETVKLDTENKLNFLIML